MWTTIALEESIGCNSLGTLESIEGLQLSEEDVDSKLWLISALNTVEVTHPPFSVSWQTIMHMFLGQLHTAYRNQGGQKELCPANIVELCSVC